MRRAVPGDSDVATSLQMRASRGDGMSGLRADGTAPVAGNDTRHGHLAFTSGGVDRLATPLAQPSDTEGRFVDRALSGRLRPGPVGTV